MAEEGADFFVELGADDVLEAAGLRIHFRVGHGEGVAEEAFGKAVAANDVASAVFPAARESDGGIIQLDKLQLGHLAQHHGGVEQAERVRRLDQRLAALFVGNPDALEQVIKALLILVGKNSDLRQAAVGQLDAAVGEAADRRVVRDDENRMAFGVELAQQVDDKLFVGFVEVARWLVGEN